MKTVKPTKKESEKIKSALNDIKKNGAKNYVPLAKL